MKKTRGLYWVSNDLRLDDNPALITASSRVDELIVVYAPGRAWHESVWHKQPASPARWQFLYEGLRCMDSQLGRLGQRLLVSDSPAQPSIAACIAHYQPAEVITSVQAGWYERQLWNQLRAQFTEIRFTAVHSHTLFDRDALPFDCSAAHLPRTFSAFRRLIESTSLAAPKPAPGKLPPPPGDIESTPVAGFAPLTKPALPPACQNAAGPHDSGFITGGERAAQEQLASYFSSAAPSHYKAVRNALDGWHHSTKFSPWLASGSLSARRIIAALRDYERRAGANESTYWIFFELLWREYFQWYAHAHGTSLFAIGGIRNKRPVDDDNSDQLWRWQNGKTDFPIVNACMNQLRRTGYLSNRGRQLVASCFVNELGMDWRAGAAWFEYHLLDYDVASNWGNWQYLAGVGADPRGKRRFDLKKQADTYDPDGQFRARWG